MERLEITPSQLRESAHTLAAAAEGIGQELSELEKEMDHVRLAWQGRAHAAFDHAQTRARLQLSGSQVELATIAQAAQQLADRYGDLDRAAAATLGGQ